MHATINVRLTASIDEDKTMPVGSLADSVTDLDLKATILDRLVGQLDD